MRVALWQYDKHKLLAGLLLFRLVYYVVPFLLSLLIHGGRELVLGLARRLTVPAGRPALNRIAGEDRKKPSILRRKAATPTALGQPDLR
jgi:hypothetical protein